ncbi:XK-related protein 7-like isoform X1 [Schistocerca serialis cubense]|uniref:XK-related protein 7-like isoform X1 n=1 Tax=Schistocerca serialis cubense TaxID=2023355 RepID=UPI00214ED247|nr:XK-related protein 7-like isoform X1 [Schistocerca serialis cubense]
MGVIESDASETSDPSASRLADTDSESESDYVTKHCRITYLAMLLPMISIITHIADVALDANLAYSYYVSAEYVHFRLTLLFILFPAFVNTVISARMYVADEYNMTLSKIATKRWLLRIFVLFFQMAPILRHCEVLVYAWKSWKAAKEKDFANQRQYYELMVKEDADAALLRLFECFLEAAPQQVLQGTIILTRTKEVSTFTYDSQMASFGSSMLNIGWSVASYQRVIRLAQQDKENITWKGTIIQFLWHFMVTGDTTHPFWKRPQCITLKRTCQRVYEPLCVQRMLLPAPSVSRILSISVASVTFPTETAVVCGVHWLIVTVWLSLWERTNFCFSQKVSATKQRAAEILFCSVLGLVYIFTYIAPKDGQNRIRYSIYYTICFAENVMAAVTVWATADTTMRNEWYFYPLLLGCIVPFVTGIGFMLLYYSCFHPVLQRVKCCDKSNNRNQTGDRGLRSTRSGSLGRNLLTQEPSNESVNEAGDT